MTKHAYRPPRRYHVEPDSFHLERRTAHLSQKETAEYLGVSLRTLRNWEKGRYSIPFPAFKLLRMRSGGIVHAPGWDGWRFDRQGALWSPDGRCFRSWELHNLSHVFRMAEYFRREHASRLGAPGAAAPPARAPRLRLAGGRHV